MLGKLLSIFVPNIPTTLPDHDPSILLASATSSRWAHTYACPFCHSSLGYQEIMTCICLTCGRLIGGSSQTRSAAKRRIVRGGRWIDTIRIRDVEYEHIDGQGWTPITP